MHNNLQQSPGWVKRVQSMQVHFSGWLWDWTKTSLTNYRVYFLFRALFTAPSLQKRLYVVYCVYSYYQYMTQKQFNLKSQRHAQNAKKSLQIDIFMRLMQSLARFNNTCCSFTAK
jgi:hypothetical protein